MSCYCLASMLIRCDGGGDDNGNGCVYGTLLEDDLRGDTSGNFKRLMTSLCMGNRSEEFHVDQERAREDARSLLQAAIFQEYQYLTGHDIDDAIKAEFSGDLEKALRAIVKVVRNKPLFFAESLHKSMKGLGTNDRQLIRIMVTRCEVDLGDISDMFQSKYGETLQSWIEGHNEHQLIRIMVTRCEVDLGDISDMFQSKYGETLQS
ncbi:Annexin [Operophtera brumata]|uniref:Annexin n=1 Tax=Operophtera brumata TaxID=104452 RepID=A0A0L7L8M0_OPEBR|nr:Annexin [Operophtera brumata]